MKNFKPALTMALILVSAPLLADSGNKNKYKDRDHGGRNQQQAYGKVIRATPIYREVRMLEPVKECWDEPVQRSTHNGGSNSAGGMLVGGLLGGIIGHQVGGGSGKKLATAVGTMIGAQVGHDAVNGNQTAQNSYTEYHERCAQRQRVSYQEVLDGYRVTYKYQGEEYQVKMPYDPGERIPLRISITPLID